MQKIFSDVAVMAGEALRQAPYQVLRNWHEDPARKRVIFSDGLDADKIVELHQQFAGRVQISFGWGTLLTNDFRGLTQNDALAPFSLVCKAIEANVKLTREALRQPEQGDGSGG